MDNSKNSPAESWVFEDSDHYKALAQKVKEEIFQDLDKYTRASEEMVSFQKTNPDVVNFELWHTLIGSTPPEALVFDAPDRKVSKFVDELAEKYLAR